MKDWKLALVVGGVALGGVAVGAQCFGARAASAQTSGYARCFVARQESVDTNGDGVIETPDLGHSFVVPSGWEVVGGAGVTATSNFLGAIVLCRH